MDYILPSAWLPWKSTSVTTTYSQALALLQDPQDLPPSHSVIIPEQEWTFWEASTSIYHSFLLILQDSHAFLGQYWNYLVIIIQLILFLVCLKILIYTLSTMEELFSLLQKLCLRCTHFLGISKPSLVINKSQYHLL